MRTAKFPRLAHAVITVCVALTLSGCAWLSRPDDDVLPPWRVAEVISVGPRSEESRAVALDCAGYSPVVAILLYHDGPRHARRMRAAKVPAPSGLRAGDRARFSTKDCGAPVLPLMLPK